MSDNVLAAAAVAAVPAEHRWCLRCLGWYLGELKTTHGIECTDVDFTCDHTPIGISETSPTTARPVVIANLQPNSR